MVESDWMEDWLPHYTDVNGVMYFYGGAFSNFVGDPITMTHPITNEPASYFTVEHWFQACKTTDLDQHERIRLEPETWTAKGHGQEVQLRDGWDGIYKFHYMMLGLEAKFKDVHFKNILLDTGDLIIAEDSPTDFTWGIRDGDGGFTGRNLLGVALMLLRDKLNGYTDAYDRAIATVQARGDNHSETDTAMISYHELASK